ncbi:M56 family metallopeptidase [soil metagenome]
MTPAFVLPAVGAFVAASLVGAGPHRVRPSTATRLLTAAIVTSGAATVAALAAAGLGFLSQLPRLDRALGWCQAVISGRDRIGPEIGLPAIALVAAMAGAGIRAVGRRRRATLLNRSDAGVEILPSNEPVAYAVPGRPGHVVISVGMICQLDAAELRVLFAHERAHLRHHHHRYLAMAEVAAAIMPLLRPLLTRLRFATERWADETAASEIGDRRLVARAIARAALASRPADVAMGFTGTGEVARVEALLDERRGGPWFGTVFALLLAALVAASATGWGIQLHHLVALLLEVCT